LKAKSMANKFSLNRIGRALDVLRDGGVKTFVRQVVGAPQPPDAFVERLLRRDAAKALSRIDSHLPHQRGLFLDCGSNLGQGFGLFEKYFPLAKFDFVLIEPNPNCIPQLKDLIRRRGGNIELIEAAAGTEVGHAKFFGLSEDHRGSTSDGGSILKDHNSVFYDPDEQRALSVPTFSLSDLIAERADRYGVVIMKVDIEGGEYDVLEDMLKNNTADRLGAIYVEFHSHFMVEPKRTEYRSRELAIAREFARRRIPFRLWH